jgi:methionyl-tRNA synthetase
MAERRKFYITTAIPYMNGAPHIGHAYEAIATDAIARFKRLDGYDVFFLTGTDEHGQKMMQTAAKEGLSARALADRNAALLADMDQALAISNDDFIRTTEPRHFRSCEELWRRMDRNGDIYLAKYAGWYAVRDEAFYDESETKIGEDGVRVGLQGTPVEWTEEDTYFFKLASYEKRLLDHYAANPDFIQPPERRNEVVSFVKGGLQDLAVSRTTFDWGIPVPGAKGHVMYVWTDALTNYITGVGFPDDKGAQFRRYWPADVHIIGKDISRFHAVYWPAFLISAGLAPPERVFVHGFLYNRGEKMSKSVGNVIAPAELVAEYGLDPLRYFFLREVPFGQDGNYSHEAIVARINADLANNLGNLAQRSLTMIAKNLGGKVPEPGKLTAVDEAFLAKIDAMLPAAREAMANYQLHRLLEGVWAVLGEGNRYFDAAEPWKLRKSDPDRMATVLYVTIEAVRQVAILVQPVMPGSAAKLLDLLGVPAGQRDFAALGPAGRLVAGTALPPPAPVFPRYVEK